MKQRILDHSDDLTLVQIRLVMDLLCSLAYPLVILDNAPHALQEYLDMLIRKQVSSSVVT